LSQPRLAAFAVLGVPMAAALLPLGVYLPPFYAQSMGLGLGTVGLGRVGLRAGAFDPAHVALTGIGSTHAKVGAMGASALIALVPSLAAIPFLFREKPATTPSRGSIARSQVAQSPLVLRVMGSDFCVCFGRGVRSALLVFFVTAYMGLTKWAALLFPLQFVFGVFAGPIWLRIGYRLGKHRTVVLAEIVRVAINLGLLFIGRFAFWPPIALTVAQGVAQGSGNLMLRAIVCDIADERRLKTGGEQAGLLFSIFNVTSNAAAAAAVAYPLLAAE